MKFEWHMERNDNYNYSAWIGQKEVCHLWKREDGNEVIYNIDDLVTGESISFSEYRSLKQEFGNPQDYKKYIFDMCNMVLVRFWKNKRDELTAIIGNVCDNNFV